MFQKSCLQWLKTKALTASLHVLINLIWEESVPLNDTELGDPDSSVDTNESFSLAVGCFLRGEQTIGREGHVWSPTWAADFVADEFHFGSHWGQLIC